MLRDATRRWRSSKATKQTRTRKFKTFKCCKMLLEVEGGERDLVVASTRHHRARLLKYYTRRPRAPSFVKSRMLRPLQTHFLLFQQIFFVLVCIHPGTPRVPPRVLASGPKPCGGKNIYSSENNYTLPSGRSENNICESLARIRCILLYVCMYRYNLAKYNYIDKNGITVRLVTSDNQKCCRLLLFSQNFSLSQTVYSV